jgi:hypothetical protein
MSAAGADAVPLSPLPLHTHIGISITPNMIEMLFNKVCLQYMYPLCHHTI